MAQRVHTGGGTETTPSARQLSQVERMENVLFNTSGGSALLELHIAGFFFILKCELLSSATVQFSDRFLKLAALSIFYSVSGSQEIIFFASFLGKKGFHLSKSTLSQR